MSVGVKNKFRTITGQNRVHRVNTGQTMLTGAKIEFQAILARVPLVFAQLGHWLGPMTGLGWLGPAQPQKIFCWAGPSPAQPS